MPALRSGEQCHTQNSTPAFIKKRDKFTYLSLSLERERETERERYSWPRAGPKISFTETCSLCTSKATLFPTQGTLAIHYILCHVHAPNDGAQNSRTLRNNDSGARLHAARSFSRTFCSAKEAAKIQSSSRSMMHDDQAVFLIIRMIVSPWSSISRSWTPKMFSYASICHLPIADHLA